MSMPPIMPPCPFMPPRPAGGLAPGSCWCCCCWERAGMPVVSMPAATMVESKVLSVIEASIEEKSQPSQPRAPQPQRIGYHRYRAQSHSRAGEDRREQQAEGGIEQARRQRDAEGVVAEGEQQVLADVAHRGVRKADRAHDTAQIALHQGD